VTASLWRYSHQRGGAIRSYEIDQEGWVRTLDDFRRLISALQSLKVTQRNCAKTAPTESRSFFGILVGARLLAFAIFMLCPALVSRTMHPSTAGILLILIAAGWRQADVIDLIHSTFL
jgi:hypothetical protein